ncbi:cytidine deaminase [Marinomonas sp.]|uniref:cytidine deaminase n=1 Tax=Marinomonas sp. TaxID=1904862 RepID=UPI003BAAC925
MSDIKKQSNELCELAKEAMSKAYVPYSRFPVGAAILTADGHIYSGCNVENAAYPEGTCAEAGAIASMVLGGDTLIKDIYVIGKGDELVTPCGGCRQKIREFSSVDTMIHICGAEGVRKSLTMNELLPFSFGPENLEQ